jgi:hypothetical protein
LLLWKALTVNNSPQLTSSKILPRLHKLATIGV